MSTSRFAMLLITVLALCANAALSNDGFPIASRISIGESDAAGMATIHGLAGAAPSGSHVILVTRETGQYVITSAATDGTFASRAFAPAGVTVLVKVDRTGETAEVLRSQTGVGGTNLAYLPGTELVVPAAPSSTGIAFAGAGLAGRYPSESDRVPAIWRMQGTLANAHLAAGQTIDVGGTISISQESSSQPATAGLLIFLCLERLTGPDGSAYLPASAFASSLLTPTGIPIERPRQYPILVESAVTLEKVGQQLQGSVALTGPLPADLPAGYYRPYLIFPEFEGISSEPIGERRFAALGPLRQPGEPFVFLPTVSVGSPSEPRLPWFLLGDVMIEGSRGIQSVEDRGVFALSPRVTTATETVVVPSRDPVTGEPIRYTLEPYAPTVACGDHGGSNEPPAMRFRFPSGEMTARITSPGGATKVLGPFPFQQVSMQNPPRLEGGGGVIADLPRLSTMRDELEIVFEEEGHHVITMEGSVEDEWGTMWKGGGTFDLYVAQTLVLDTGVLPGTPFETGDAASAAVIIDPPVAAEIDVRYRFAPDSDPSRMIERHVVGRANRFGTFLPNDGFRFDAAGEYRIDVVASYRDASNHLWMGARTWSGAVAARSSGIIAHGRRGIDLGPKIASQWFRRSDLGMPLSGPASHIPFPFASGDVAWLEDDPREFAVPLVSFQETATDLAGLLRPRCCPGLSGPPFTFEERLTLGEIPLFASRPGGLSIDIDPSKIDLWAYSYRSVQRPLVRVREIVGEDFTIAPYWNFDSPYHQQAGVGANGDLPNDFKFQFGGVVLRGPAVDTPLFAIYASLAIMIPSGDPLESRVFPPFQGNGGGPDGGPLFSLKGEDIDIFFHPTGVRPGTILHRGQRASFAGYSAPTLPSKIEILVTSPSGMTRTIRGQANLIGYFHDPSQDFTVIEPGVWKAKVKILFDGRTSAGQVTEPFPAGDVLGSREGEFWFYVVDSRSEQLDLETTVGRTLRARRGGFGEAALPAATFLRPADGPITFTITPPTGLTNLEMHTTTTMPGFILEDKRSSALTYVYDAQTLAQDFPNLDLHDADGFAGADTITISFLVSGTDASGARKHHARQIVIQGEELQMPDQHPRPRRRGVRR